MNLAQIIASLVFLLGYAGIILEHRAHVNKAAVALVMGGLLWVVAGLADPSIVASTLSESSAEVFSIVVFLLASMILVEVLVYYRVFDYLQVKLSNKGIGAKKQFWVVAVMAFLLSTVISNLTVVIVMIQIARKFFWGRNLLVVAAAIIISSNAGGAFSPIGDVTTIMLWFADKFTATDVLVEGFLPSIALFLVSCGLLYKKIEPEVTAIKDSVVRICPIISRTDKAVIASVALAFLLPVVARMVNVPPVVGILLGVGITWLVVDAFRHLTRERTHLNASIEGMIQKTDMSSIQFFIGILLAVAAMSSLGILDKISHVFYGTQSVPAVISGNVLLGIISGIFDNIPLTAVALEVLQTQSSSLWVLLAISVGTGGSLFLVGSASGVVASGMLKKLTFLEYAKIAFIPALLGFFAAIGVWLIQYFLFG